VKHRRERRDRFGQRDAAVVVCAVRADTTRENRACDGSVSGACAVASRKTAPPRPSASSVGAGTAPFGCADPIGPQRIHGDEDKVMRSRTPDGFSSVRRNSRQQEDS
jgi:hypothetical protein